MSSRQSDFERASLPDLAGRTCVVTGATSGIGREIVRALAAAGASLVLIGRDSRRTRDLAQTLTAMRNQRAHAVLADLADLGAVRGAAREISTVHPKLDVLINNAGIWITQPASNADGIELTWATNLLAHHVLAGMLMPCLRAATGARIVNVASTYVGNLDLDDVEFKRRPWNGIAAYKQSKLAMRMWTWALATRLSGSGVTANAVHPGGIYTGIYRAPRGIVGSIIRLHARLTKASPREGADTPVWAATAPELEGVTGRFFANRKELSCPHRDASSLDRLWNLLQSQAGSGLLFPADRMSSGAERAEIDTV